MAKVLDLDATENKVCKQYRKDIFKKIAHLPFSEKRNVLKKVDEEFLNILENIDMSRPRRVNYFTHYDRFYLSARLSCVDKAIKENQIFEYKMLIFNFINVKNLYIMYLP